MSQKIKYEGSFLEDTGLNKLWGNLWNADPAKWLPPNEAQRQLMAAKYMSNAGQNEFINNSTQRLGGQKRTPTTMFTPVAGTDSFANPNNIPDLGLQRVQYDQGADALQYKNYERGMSGLPPFDANGNVTPVGTGSVLKPLEMFSGYGRIPQGTGATPSDGTVAPIFPSLAQPQAVQSSAVSSLGAPSAAVQPQGLTAEQRFNQNQAALLDNMQSGNMDSAFDIGFLATGQVSPGTGTDSFSMWDSLGLSDMTSKDIYQGLGATAQLGLGAYGMFKSLGQMDRRLDQGQQQINLSREEYEENLRHRQAIVAQNERA